MQVSTPSWTEVVCRWDYTFNNLMYTSNTDQMLWKTLSEALSNVHLSQGKLFHSL